MQGGPLGVLHLGALVDGDERHGLGVIQPLGKFLLAQAEVRADLVLLGDAAQALLEVVDRLLHLAGAGAGAARAPVHPAQLVEDRPADAHGGVGGERAALLRVVLAHGGDKPGDTDTVEIVGLDMRRQVELDPIDYISDQREVAFDQFLLIKVARTDTLVGAPRGG